MAAVCRNVSQITTPSCLLTYISFRMIDEHERSEKYVHLGGFVPRLHDSEGHGGLHEITHLEYYWIDGFVATNDREDVSISGISE